MNNIKIVSLVILFVLQMGVVNAQMQYEISLDLNVVEKDRVKVTIKVPSINEDTIEYHMAKIVPGTYSISDFGRFVSSFLAHDSGGNLLEVNQLSTNRWQIINAQNLSEITYWIDDSFDDFDNYGENTLFEPGAVSFEKERDVFVLNTFGIAGYLEGHQMTPYQLNIKHPKDIYGVTSLEKIKSSAQEDIYMAKNFNFFADAPLMYGALDTVSQTIAEANVQVAVYSPNQVLSARDVLDEIDELMLAQAKYLGGKLPVDRYVYLIYLMDSPSLSGAMGALEHSYSSLYTLPEAEISVLGKTIKDVAAHEFFHILTPLNIHSEEIHNFNYIEPKMSQHLWLYEGSTEYAAHHTQVKYGFITGDEFVSIIEDKLNESDEYDITTSYTEFSKNILTPENTEKYSDVYSGGAIISMALDLIILKTSDGTKDLQMVLRELSKKYGPHRAFKDEELFGEIEKITSKEVGDFLRKHVGGNEPIALAKFFDWVGWIYSTQKEIEVPSRGGIGLNLNENQEIIIDDISKIDSFGEKMGFEAGDILYKWQGKKLTLGTVQNILQDFLSETKEGDKVVVEVRRKKGEKLKKIKLKSKAVTTQSIKKHHIESDAQPTTEKLALRHRWIGKH